MNRRERKIAEERKKLLDLPPALAKWHAPSVFRLSLLASLKAKTSQTEWRYSRCMQSGRFGSTRS